MFQRDCRVSKGSTNCQNSILDLAGTEIWKYGYPVDSEGKSTNSVSVDPYVQEHIDLVTAIRTGKPINEAENTAISTMNAIMGRISAYTGKEVTYEELMNSDLKLGPKVFEFGPVDMDKTVPIAGVAYVPEAEKVYIQQLSENGLFKETLHKKSHHYRSRLTGCSCSFWERFIYKKTESKRSC